MEHDILASSSRMDSYERGVKSIQGKDGKQIITSSEHNYNIGDTITYRECDEHGNLTGRFFGPLLITAVGDVEFGYVTISFQTLNVDKNE